MKRRSRLWRLYVGVLSFVLYGTIMLPLCVAAAAAGGPLGRLWSILFYAAATLIGAPIYGWLVVRGLRLSSAKSGDRAVRKEAWIPALIGAGCSGVVFATVGLAIHESFPSLDDGFTYWIAINGPILTLFLRAEKTAGTA